jgi:hypothetical protein
MQSLMYSSAVSELAITALSKFLKEKEATTGTIENWTKIKAGEKREAFKAMLEGNKEARKEFVVFYGDQTGTASDFSEWEQGDLPYLEGGGGAAEEAPQTVPPATDTGLSVATAEGPVPQFVEGAFHQIVADVAGLSAQDSDTNLRQIEDNLEYEHLRMGILLAHIQHSEHYITLGYDNMREYLTAHTGLHYRKAMFLISNAKAVQEIGIEAKELKGVSWSALRYIVQVMTPENYKQWLEAAASSTHVSLIEQIRAYNAKQAGALPPPTTEGEDKPKPQSKLFNLYPDQKESVNAAIEKAKAEGNVESTGAALDLICASFTGKPPTDTTVGNVLPDTSVAGMINVFSKMNADQGIDGLLVVLEAVGGVWPDVDINVQLPEGQAAAE